MRGGAWSINQCALEGIAWLEASIAVRCRGCLILGIHTGAIAGSVMGVSHRGSIHHVVALREKRGSGARAHYRCPGADAEPAQPEADRSVKAGSVRLQPSRYLEKLLGKNRRTSMGNWVGDVQI